MRWKLFRAMIRNYSAIGFKIYLIVVTIPVAVGVVPMPGTLAQEAPWYGFVTLWGVVVGCAISLVGIFMKDRLDGSVWEQVGLTSVILGLIGYALALTKALPTSWWPMALCFGLAFFFSLQWREIWKWRKPLRKMVKAHGNRVH